MIWYPNNSEGNKIKELSESSSRSNKSGMREMISKVASFCMAKCGLMTLVSLETNLVDLLTNMAMNCFDVIIIFHVESLFLKRRKGRLQRLPFHTAFSFNLTIAKIFSNQLPISCKVCDSNT
jgi:hypothetical protein